MNTGSHCVCHSKVEGEDLNPLFLEDDEEEVARGGDA